MISYRAARSDDAAALDRIFETSFRDTFAHLYRAEDLAEFLSGFGTGYWEKQLADPEYAFRIAEAEGEPVAYVKLGPLKLPVEPTGSALLFDQLYVLKEHRGVGIARQLTDWALLEARRRGAEELYLTVYVDNHRAPRLYDGYGFEVVARYDFMVGSHADEDLIMRKLL